MKTKEKIQEEIKKLKELLPNIRPMSAFGDDNKAQLEVQIAVLVNDWDNDDIYNRYDHSGVATETLDAALSARQWLEGEYDVNTLSEDWEVLREQ